MTHAWRLVGLAAVLAATAAISGADETPAERIRDLEAKNRLLERQHQTDIERIEALRRKCEALEARLAGDEPKPAAEKPADEQPVEQDEGRPLTRARLLSMVRQAYTFRRDATALQKKKQIDRLKADVVGKTLTLAATVKGVAPDGTVTALYESPRTVKENQAMGMGGFSISTRVAEVPLERVDVRMSMTTKAAADLHQGKQTILVGVVREIDVKRTGRGSRRKPVHVALVMQP